ncbi:hypothetical protein PR202_ga13964 [Eleusine coracana subsp. coracana]|uniref:Reverse transcriptase zinc-binding domain-containing protein n=1 Tax=Eleusine coracana subsp. coracana TaxID=191504 RepID=A0AAV5CGA0_ELECO|nr:hypothetical protein PR202_ga13964 [Eleusine coracana subsp. coracana]
MFDSSVEVRLGDGNLALFWTDRWLDGKKISDIAPCLAAAVPKQHKTIRTVQEALTDNNWADDVEGALTSEVIMEYIHLWHRLLSVDLQLGVEDTVCWRWTSSGQYSTSSAYSAFFMGVTTFPLADHLWHSFAPMRCKFFIWLCLHRRLWTADRRLHRGLDTHVVCPLCGSHQEKIDHLLAECAYTRQIWRRMLDILQLGDVPLSSSVEDLWLRLRPRATRDKRSGLDSCFMLVSWMLWKERNARIFDHKLSNLDQTMHAIREVAREWQMAGVQKLRELWPLANIASPSFHVDQLSVNHNIL